jgi:hypothetical protein
MYRALSLCALLLIGGYAPAGEGQRQVRILAVLPPDDAPLRVAFVTDGEYTRGIVFAGLVMALINSATVKHRNEPLEAQLRLTLAGFERSPPLADAVKRSFAKFAGVFDVATTTERGRYLDENGLTQVAAGEGYDYLLAMDGEFSGLWMGGAYTRTDDLTPALTIRYRMLRVSDAGLVLKGVVTGYGIERRPYKEAVLDREFFVKVWPQVCAAIAGRITGDLNRNDKLHWMAARVDRGDEVPAIGTLLKKYENSFKFELTPVKGWRLTRLDTKYARVLEPADETNRIFGLRFDVDLLVPEFGQDVRTVEEYIAAYGLRRSEMLPNSSPLEKWDGLAAPGFEVYRSSTGDGGDNIVMFRKFGDLHMEVVNAVFLREFDKYYPLNRGKIEAMIASSEIRLR